MPYRNANDETLVMLTLAGQQTAYGVLVTRYQTAVISAAVKVTRTRFMADGAAQDAFVTAWMKLDSLSDPARFGPWVCRIAKNCAVNLLRRYRGYLSFDVVENREPDHGETPVELIERAEDRDEVRRTVEKLPAKIGQIVHMHYFEGLSIVEIADRLRISPGTVKSQLHDGRKKMRKELCAMNEKWNDTLTERIMKKVNELKLWQLRQSKDGFRVIYKDVLKEVEELPESNKKYAALADVLVRGWWWIPGDKSDALFARIKEAAELGHNQEVMEFITMREDNNIPFYDTDARIEFVRNRQIPYLEKLGFPKVLAREWYWLGHCYFRAGRREEGLAAYEKARTYLTAADLYHTLAVGTPKLKEMLTGAYKDKDENRFMIGCSARELRNIDGEYLYWQTESDAEGGLRSHEMNIIRMLERAACCDGRYFDPSLHPGEKRIGSDGTTLTYQTNDTVETPAGTFENCSLWVTDHNDENQGRIILSVWYKDGVGIVKYQVTSDGIATTVLLDSYRITGGTGLLPLCVGNSWHYLSDTDPAYLRYELSHTVTHFDDRSAIISSETAVERFAYDENSWTDMIDMIRNEYYTDRDGGQERLCDVTPAIARAEALAVTPMEKAHTKAAASVMRRILETDAQFNPNRTADGFWNFFGRDLIHRDRGRVTVTSGFRWSFEWKGYDDGIEPLLNNDIYGILQDAGNCLWSEEWTPGCDTIIEYDLYGRPLKTKINCTDAGSITTAAGSFENCIRISFDIAGMGDGYTYRGGYKEYYFAPCIGIVRAVHKLSELKNVTYDLVAYEGEGEGYMPFEDGMTRRYEGIGFTDGLYGAASYTYVKDQNGDIVIFSDQTGLRHLPPVITSYTAIAGEQEEAKLWASGQHNESRLRHAVNNLHLLLHFLNRHDRTWAAAEHAAAWEAYKIKLIETLMQDGKLPEAWLGYYRSLHFMAACTHFGAGKKEDGYAYLERTFEMYEEWEAIPDGAALDIGDPLIFGGVKLIKGKDMLLLPDGSKEHLPNLRIYGADRMYYGMTAPSGWEWFDPVRKEERFQAYVAKAKALVEEK